QVSPFTGQTVSAHNWNTRVPNQLSLISAPCGGAAIVTCFAQPLILQNDVYSSAASAIYHGGIFEVKKRFGSHMTLMASYTYSKAISNATDFNSDFSPFDQTNLGTGERGLSDFDQRHKVVVASVMESPSKSGFFSGFQLAPIVRYNSGHPYNVLSAGDINGDRHSTNDRPLGYGHNAGEGADFFDVDARLTKSFRLGERNRLQLTAEAFNLFNRTNFGSINNSYTVLGGFANPHFASARPTGRFLNPSVAAPGGAEGAFTSGAGSFARRQLQLGARWVF